MEKSIDLSAFDGAIERQESGIDVQIFGMDGKTATGLSIRVAGPDSERAALARNELHQELVRSERTEPLSGAELTEQGTRFLAKITLGWSPNVRVGGDELAFSEANAIRVYEKYRFIRQQVDAAAGSRAAFMVASSSSSATPSRQD